MARGPARELRYRIGCPLALLLAAAPAILIETLYYQGPIHGGDLVFLVGFVGLPFGALALARARDWLAWLLAAGLMAGAWIGAGYVIRSSTDIMRGFGFMMAPLAIAGLCLAVAGMRGRIPWAREGKDAGAED